MNYFIENEFIKAEISLLGAILVRFISKKSDVDIVLGFDSEEDYLKHSSTYIGAVVGRNCNRIGNARFHLNDIEYQLSVNNNHNQLHGGVEGFGSKRWNLVDKKDDEIVLSYHSVDGEEGYPGNLDVVVSYKLEENSLIFSFKGNCDKDTLFNITNHSYFNLGDDTILDEYLYISTDKYSPTDEYSLTLDEVEDVKGTPYDFSEFKLIRDSVESLEMGIDNNYVWENFHDVLVCSLKNDQRQLNIYSDLPDMHVYTGAYLGGEVGKYGKTYKKYQGIALECQYYPNGINYGGKFLLPILKKGETISHYIKYEIVEF